MAYLSAFTAPRTEERIVGRVQVESDDGKTDTVIIRQEFMETNEVRPAGQPSNWIEGRKRLALSDGSPVKQIDPETFQILDTNRIVRKIN